MKLRMMIGVLTLAPALACAAGWQTAQPWPGNPLKTATLEGKALSGNHQGKAWLTFFCRPDAPQPHMQVTIDSDAFKTFPLASFEGPGGAGEITPLLSVLAGEDNQAQPYISSANYQQGEDGTPQFQWHLSPEKPSVIRWMNATGMRFIVQIQAPEGAPETLRATFTLPEDPGRFNAVMTPCLKASNDRAFLHPDTHGSSLAARAPAQ